MDRDRRAAYLILKDINDNETWSNLAVGQQFSKEKPASPAFVREIVYGVLRNQFLLDYTINGFLAKPGLKGAERIFLRMGFYELAFMDTANHAAINETVNLVKSFKKGREGFINAVLRNFQRSGNELKTPDKEKNYEEYLSVRYSVDKSIVSHYIDVFGAEKAEEILCNNNIAAKLCIRVNTLVISEAEFSKLLQAKGFQVEKAEEGLFVKGSGLLDLKEFKKGLFSVQGEESQIAVKVLDPKPGDRVIDLCAAPGGKSCAMAQLMENKGLIKAFDILDHRVNLIKKESQRLGISVIEAAILDSTILNPELAGTADCVLADVPCSVLGTAKKNPEIKLRKLDYSGLLQTQAKILENAALYVKKGGRLLYSTCTINPFENEKQIEAFLEKGKFEKLYEKQFLPDESGKEGFYICLLRKF